MTRRTITTTKTSVRHVAVPMGRARENGPHLADIRAFVAECDGLPDELLVRIESGSLSEGGLRDVTLSVTHTHPAADTAAVSDS